MPNAVIATEAGGHRTAVMRLTYGVAMPCRSGSLASLISRPGPVSVEGGRGTSNRKRTSDSPQARSNGSRFGVGEPGNRKKPTCSIASRALRV
jgi:hypothetical protein